MQIANDNKINYLKAYYKNNIKHICITVIHFL